MILLKLNLYFTIAKHSILKLVHCFINLDLSSIYYNLRHLDNTKLSFIQSYSLIQALRLITFVP